MGDGNGGRLVMDLAAWEVEGEGEGEEDDGN